MMANTPQVIRSCWLFNCNGEFRRRRKIPAHKAITCTEGDVECPNCETATSPADPNLAGLGFSELSSRVMRTSRKLTYVPDVDVRSFRRPRVLAKSSAVLTRCFVGA